MNLSFRSEEIEKSLELTEEGTEIVNLLEPKQIKSFIQEKKAGIFLLEQLCDETGSKLFTWKQIKQCKQHKAAGKVPDWFRKIEKKVLENEESHTIKSNFKTKAINTLSPKIICSIIDNDKRKKEWILLRNRKNEIRIGKVNGKKEHRTFLIEHWEMILNPDNSMVRFKKCPGCEQNMKENARPESCLKKKKLKNRAVMINPNLVRKVDFQAHMRELAVPVDCQLDTHFGPKVLEGYDDERYEDLAKEILIYPLEKKIIDQALESIQIKEELNRLAIYLK